MGATMAQRRKNDPKGMRGRILDGAYELFQSHGYNGTSVLDVTAACSVSPGALHYHFPNKKALGLAVIDERVAAEVEETWLAPVRDAPNGAVAVIGVFHAIADALDRQGAVRGCPINNLTLELSFAEPDFRRTLKALFDKWRAVISAVIDGPDAEARATLVVAAYSGAMALAKAEQRGDALRLCADRLQPVLGLQIGS